MPTALHAINDLIAPYKRKILIVCLMLMFSVAGGMLFKWYTTQAMTGKDIANDAGRDKTIELFMFTVSWCKHCTQALPEWNKFLAKYNKQTINGYVINCNSIDCTEPISPQTQEMMTTLKIKAFPTLKIMVDGQSVVFDAKITYDNLDNFVKKITAA